MVKRLPQEDIQGLLKARLMSRIVYVWVHSFLHFLGVTASLICYSRALLLCIRKNNMRGFPLKKCGFLKAVQMKLVGEEGRCVFRSHVSKHHKKYTATRPQGVVQEWIRVILLGDKHKDRNLPRQPCSDIGGKFIYSWRTKALRKDKEEEMGLNE